MLERRGLRAEAVKRGRQGEVLVTYFEPEGLGGVRFEIVREVASRRMLAAWQAVGRTEKESQMPIITVQQQPHDPRQTRALIDVLTQAVVAAYDVDPGVMRIIVQEVAPEHCAKGGVPRSERSATASR
jgi:phenylpyruvate tautomerase PptA (4-oxalocrotonate tautomerase family)